MTKRTGRAHVHPRAALAAVSLVGVALSPARAAACDPNCPAVTALLVGVPTTAATAFLAPALVRSVAGRSDVPYWGAVAITAAASTAAVVAVKGTLDPYGQRGGVGRMVAAPALAGSAAAALTYWLWPRRTPAPARARPWAPAVSPSPAGGLRLDWQF
jgi:hypothetical protein